MPEILLTKFAVTPFSLLVLYAVALGYLLSVRQKSEATWWLAGTFVGLALFNLTSVVGSSSYFPSQRTQAIQAFAFALGTYTFVGSYAQFAYRFLENPFRKEARIALWVSFVLTLIVWSLFGYQVLVPAAELPLLNVIIPGLLLSLLGLATIVLVRKWRHAAGKDVRTARAFRAYAVVNVLLVVFLLLIVLNEAEVVAAFEGALFPLTMASQMGFFFGLIVVYLNYAPEPTSFQAKLIGLSLVTVLAILGIAPEIVLHDKQMYRAEHDIAEEQALRFTPDGAGGYDVAAIPYEFDEDLGAPLELIGGQDTTVALAFGFPFYDDTHGSVAIENDPILIFGEAMEGFGDFYSSEHPMIVPLMTNLNPGWRGGVYLKQDSSAAVFTWHEVPIASEWSLSVIPGTASVQTILRADGVIDFVYGRIDRSDAWVRGITPGGRTPALSTNWSRISNPRKLDAGDPWIESLTDQQSVSRERLRLSPAAGGGFDFERSSGSMMREFGGNLELGDDSARAVALGFDFPFGETTWDSMFVSPNGAISFGEPLYGAARAIHNPAFLLSDQPKIAPLSTDLDPGAGGGVFFRQAGDRAVVTWQNVPQFQTDRSNTFQLILERSGGIEMVFDEVNLGSSAAQNAMRAVVPPGTSRSSRVGSLQGLPAHIQPGASFIEDYDLASRKRTHEAILPVVWLIIASALFILLAFPFFFRSSLVTPLMRLREGMRRVNEGDLGAEIPVGVRDEIGYLTHHFNRMTESLRQYSSQMEALVAERTEELERSLDELKSAQAQLVQQEKLASLGQLTAGIAHEIKNPLNFINNFSNLTKDLAEELEEEMFSQKDRRVDEVAEELASLLADLKLNASKIEEHGRRADSIVRSMMEHARAGEGKRELVDVNELVEEYIDLAWHGKRAQAPGFDVMIKRDLDESAGEAHVVPQEIGRVVLNLIGNAFDALTERGERVDGHYAPTVRVSTSGTETTVEIRVEDNGSGISNSVCEKIFEPFFTTKPAGSGTGLGLSLSYDIITQGHIGKLYVDGDGEQGATFVIELPRRVGTPGGNA